MEAWQAPEKPAAALAELVTSKDQIGKTLPTNLPFVIYQAIGIKGGGAAMWHKSPANFTRQGDISD